MSDVGALADAPMANKGFFVTHFLTVRDQEESKDFYVRILGEKVIKAENPCYTKLANTWIILDSAGGPTPDDSLRHLLDPLRPPRRGREWIGKVLRFV